MRRQRRCNLLLPSAPGGAAISTTVTTAAAAAATTAAAMPRLKVGSEFVDGGGEPRLDRVGRLHRLPVVVREGVLEDQHTVIHKTAATWTTSIAAAAAEERTCVGVRRDAIADRAKVHRLLHHFQVARRQVNNHRLGEPRMCDRVGGR